MSSVDKTNNWKGNLYIEFNGFKDVSDKKVLFMLHSVSKFLLQWKIYNDWKIFLNNWIGFLELKYHFNWKIVRFQWLLSHRFQRISWNKITKEIGKHFQRVFDLEHDHRFEEQERVVFYADNPKRLGKFFNYGSLYLWLFLGNSWENYLKSYMGTQQIFPKNHSL